MLYTEKEKHEIERVKEVFTEHLRQSPDFELLWSDKVGYVWLTIGVNPLYVDTGIRIESAADLCCKCLDDVATDVLYMTGNDHALEAADPLELAPNILFLGNFALSRTVIKGTITPNKSSIPHFGTQYDDVLILHFFIVKNVQNDNRNTKVNFTELRDLQKWLTSPKLPCSLFVDSYDQTDTVEYVAFIYGRVQTGCQKRNKLFSQKNPRTLYKMSENIYCKWEKIGLEQLKRTLENPRVLMYNLLRR